MLSIATGHDCGYLTGPVAGGREGYYTAATAAGEPPGLWYGAGAEALGLRGEVDADLMEAMYSRLLDPRDPAAHSRRTWDDAEPLAKAHRAYRDADAIYAGLLETHPDAGPERRAELRAQAEQSARQAVSFIDVTFSAPKSVSVLGVAFERAANDARRAGDDRAADAWDAHARAVEDAVLAGARAGIDYLQDAAGYSRVGHHGGGAGRWVDAHGWVVAQFLQHDSRDRDPQLHVHNAILNRVRCADGTYRALDSRAIHAFRGAAGAIAERVMEAHLTRALGVRFETRPDGRAREVMGVRREVIDLFSSRRHAVTAKTAKLLAAFTARFGRDPSALERTRLSQQATLATRSAKSHNGEALGERLDRWEHEARTAVAGGLAEVANDVLDRAQQVDPAAQWSQRDVTERALAAVAGTKAAWSRSDLTRAVSDALPGHLHLLDPEHVRALLEGLTDAALCDAVRITPEVDTTNLPADGRLADGRSAYSGPGVELWATYGQLAADRGLRAAAARRGGARFTAATATAVMARFAGSGVELGADQAAAVRGVLTSGAALETLSAPAGTGKSFVVGAIADAWTGAGHRVFGLAPSQVAAQVLTDEGVNARNVAQWLAAQARLDHARPGSADPGADGTWRLQRDDLVVVDEAGMTSTGDLAEIQWRCELAGAKLLLVGDPRQLAPVGPGGTLADVAEHGVRYELAEVRRFRADWEGTASLLLRDGDRDAVGAYDRHGRLVDGGTVEQAANAAGRAWLADTLAGRDSLLVVGSNEAAAAASASLRAELVALGRVEQTGVELGMQGTVAGVGDLVQARRNGWPLIGWEGNARAPINRQCYRVTALRPDGGLTVAPVHGRVDGAEQLGGPLQLPAGYVAEHVTLGYASTVHAAQGRTVDTAHTVIAAGTDTASAYVALTRGRDRNTAYAVTVATPSDAPTGQARTVEARTAVAVLTDVLERARQERSALAQQQQATFASRSTMLHVDQLIDVVADKVTAGRTAATLDRLAAEGALSPQHRGALAADEAFGTLEGLLRTVELAGHDPAEVLTAAVAERTLDGALSPVQVLHHRITSSLHGRLTPQITAAADLIPPDRDVPEEWRTWLHDRAEDADTRRRELGAETAEQAPQWATDALGPVPTDALARAEWEHKAGFAASYRELAGHTDETDPLGRAPGAGLPEKAGLFRAAHEALELPDRGDGEANLSDGRLRIRSQALEREKAWAPRYVGDELAATSQQAERARTDATLWAARGEVTDDPAEREALRADADRARAEAETLTGRAADLEAADAARGAWFAATAATRDTAERARAELKARGVDLDDPGDRVTADEWLAAHRGEQVAADADREVRDEHELADTGTDTDHAAPAHVVAEDTAETAVADVRDTATRDATETTDPAERRRVPTADETAAAVARAQEALAEIAARAEADAAREARDADDHARREELTRWAEQDRATERAAIDREDELVRER